MTANTLFTGSIQSSLSKHDLEAALVAWPYLAWEVNCPSRESAGQLLSENYFAQTLEPEAEKLTLTWRDTPEGRWVCGYRKLEWDSNHFNFGIGTLDPLICPTVEISDDVIVAGTQLIEWCLAQCANEGLKFISASVSPGDTATQFCLNKLGFVMTDTIQTFKLDLCASMDWIPDPNIRPASVRDAEILCEIAEKCFGNRIFNVNRFNSDPLFSPEKVRLLYRIWTEKSLSGALADEVLVFWDGERPIGFTTIQLPSVRDGAPEYGTGRLHLTAIDPAWHRRGIYSQLMKACAVWSRQRSVSSLLGTTQLSNLPIQRAFMRAGGRLVESRHRYRKALT